MLANIIWIRNFEIKASSFLKMFPGGPALKFPQPDRDTVRQVELVESISCRRGCGRKENSNQSALETGDFSVHQRAKTLDSRGRQPEPQVRRILPSASSPGTFPIVSLAEFRPTIQKTTAKVVTCQVQSESSMAPEIAGSSKQRAQSTAG
jgi:hypothetical protein